MKLTHVDAEGRARMVDVSGKPDTERVAVARGEVVMQPETLRLIRAGAIEKGDVLAVARVAGIMAAKRVHELIPMCHPLMITHVELEFEFSRSEGSGVNEGEQAAGRAETKEQRAENKEQRAAIGITATVKTRGKTGVEMEALTAVAIAALTIYDMAKAVDRGMRIQNVRLVRKSGGKSGDIVLE